MTIIFPSEITTQECAIIRARMDADYKNLVQQRFQKIYDLYHIYLKNDKIPNHKSADKMESSIGFLYLKLANPEYHEIMHQEIKYLISLQSDN